MDSVLIVECYLKCAAQPRPPKKKFTSRHWSECVCLCVCVCVSPCGGVCLSHLNVLWGVCVWWVARWGGLCGGWCGCVCVWIILCVCVWINGMCSDDVCCVVCMLMLQLLLCMGLCFVSLVGCVHV